MAQGKGGIAKWIGIGCGAFMLLGACCGAGGYLFYRTQMDPPAAMVRGFFGDLRRGEHQSALSRMDGAYQASHPLPAFQQNVQQIPALTQQSDFSSDEVQTNNDVSNVTGILQTPNGEQVAMVQLRKHGEHWYITSVRVGDQMLQ